jgi:hypothetical protein
MGYKGTLLHSNWSLGEISPRSLGRCEDTKPIYKSGAAIIENMLIGQACSVANRPGTQYVAPTKFSTTYPSCLRKFTYSVTQAYMLEIGNLYMRFFSNFNGVPGQVVVPSATAWQTSTSYVPGNYVTQSAIIYYCLIAHTSGTFATDLAAGDWVAQSILEIPTIFLQADIFNIMTAQNADVMYMVNTNYFPQKLSRTSATAFNIANVPFVRGPFRPLNVSATTITPSSATGTTTLTASTAIFNAGHVGSLWQVGTDGSVANSGVVKITAFTDSTHVTGTVQAEPNGTAGNLGTTSGVTFWAEGAFSTYRGFPSAVVFHEGRLVYLMGQTLYGSTVDTYDDFSSGTTTDSDAYQYQIAASQANTGRWLASDTALEIGTSGGSITAADGSPAVGISPTTPPNITFDNNYGVMYQPPVMLGGYLFYIQANTFTIRQLTYDLITSKYKATNMMVLADHILRDGSGAVQMASQVSPYDRIWVVRGDGQIAVFTRDPDQQVEGWSRIVAGQSDGVIPGGLAGTFVSLDIIPIDGADDQIWCVCQRKINGVEVYWVEVFTDELFNNYWEPVRLDASLTYNDTLNITAMTTEVVPNNAMYDDAGNLMFDSSGEVMTD